MKQLAKAVVQSAAFLELSSDEVIDPDAAVSALEDLGHAISEMSLPEREALRVATLDAIRAELALPGTHPGALRFYEHFFVNFCMDFAPPTLEAPEARDYWRRRLDGATLPPGWSALDPSRATSLEHELTRELSPPHKLFGHTVLAIAGGPHPDDILVAPQSFVGPLHSVHLTWSAETTADWPHAQEFATFDDFCVASDPDESD